MVIWQGVLSKLRRLERFVGCLRWGSVLEGLFRQRTETEISQVFGISKQRVHRIVNEKPAIHWQAAVKEYVESINAERMSS